jgi:RimJ/RimL family protein N-acetyltransferase
MPLSLRAPTKQEFLALRPQRFSAFALAFDDPDRPLPDEADELLWWQAEVVSGRHRLAVLEHPVFGLSAIFHAFSFGDDERSCEVGFSLLSAELVKKGLATLGLSLWLRDLGGQGVRTVTSEINRLNEGARRVLEKTGFSAVESYRDGPIDWQVWERLLPP